MFFEQNKLPTESSIRPIPLLFELFDQQGTKIIVDSKISLANLQKLKLINKKYKKLKLLGDGVLKQKLDVVVNSISKSAKEKVEKLGGKITLIK